jgi:hypothetical protein
MKTITLTITDVTAKLIKEQGNNANMQALLGSVEFDEEDNLYAHAIITNLTPSRIVDEDSVKTTVEKYDKAGNA